MATGFAAPSTVEWVQEEFSHLAIKCGRVLQRFIRTMSTLAKKPKESIACASSNRAEAKAIYRLLGNDVLQEEVILAAHKKATISRMTDSRQPVILCIQDTTEFNYTSHKKTTGLGDGTKKNTRGLITHTAIAVTPAGVALGLLDQKTWARDPLQRGKSYDRQRPIEEKESYKWLESMQRSNANMPKGITVVNVCDREADVYEFFAKAIQEHRYFLVRLVQNRKLAEGTKLLDSLNEANALGKVSVSIPRDTRNNYPERIATLEIRCCQARVLMPQQAKRTESSPGSVVLSVILAKEIDAPEGVKPIEWYMATNLEVVHFDDACQKVQWYVQRWKIERFHYVLKEGCAVEKIQERDASQLKKLIAMYSVIAIRILGMTYAARQTPNESCESFFMENEWKTLYRMANNGLQAPTQAPTIKEAVTHLAKLGGFLGRNSDGEPGVKVIWRGLNELNIVLKYQQLFLDNYGTTVGQA